MLACLATAVGSLGVRTLLVELGHPIMAYVLTPSRLDLYEAPLLRLKALFPYDAAGGPADSDRVRPRPGHAA